MDGILLKNISVNANLVSFHFESYGIIRDYLTTDIMWIEYDEDISSIPKSILCIPFVSSLLPLMWLTNTVMWVEELDRTFYDAIHRIKQAYQDLYNHYPLKGNLVSARFVENTYEPKSESLLLFSGGIDANATYVRIRQMHPHLFNIQGWYKQFDNKDAAAEADKRDISAFAKKHELGFSFARSNFAVLVNSKLFDKNIKQTFHDGWWHGFQHSMSFISIAIPLAYKRAIRNIYIASSVPIGEYVMCASHVNVDSEFKFATVGGCIHDGSELTRQDKVHTIVSYVNEVGGDYPIRVCSFNDHNCCACDKCFRSILGIIAEGGDIKQYGFFIDGNLKDYFVNLMHNNIQFFNIRGESSLHWPAIRRRMKENYDLIQEKDFVDWFLNTDFMTLRKKGVLRYYRKNFFSILKRKCGM